MSTEYAIQRFRGGWAVVLTGADGKRIRRRLYAADRLGAEVEARQRIAAGDNSAWTVGRIVEAYIADGEMREIATSSRMHDAWKAMRATWADVRPADIDEGFCRAYAKMRDRAAATVRYELGMLATAFSWAKKQRHIPDVPTIWRPAPPERIERHLTRDQFDKFLAAIRAPHARLYAVLGITTAARPTAILQLRWQQVDFDRGLIRLNPEGRAQTAKGRATVPMNARCRTELEAAWEARQGPCVIEHGGKPIHSVKKAFQLASQRCGFRVTPYMLRHTAAVWMAEGAVPMEEIASFMGHRDTRTTYQHYARYSPDYLRKAASALEW